jgi:hypothetical protein
LGVAVSAAEQIRERVVRQGVNRPLLGIGRYYIGLAAVGDDELVVNL